MNAKKSPYAKGAKEKVCLNCGTKETPLWRRSRNGADLCNACGLYYRNHSEHRPILKFTGHQANQIPRQVHLELSTMEKIAIDVLSEMRSQTRDFSRNDAFHKESKSNQPGSQGRDCRRLVAPDNDKLDELDGPIIQVRHNTACDQAYSAMRGYYRGWPMMHSIDGLYLKKQGIGYYLVDNRDYEDFQEVVNRLASLSDQ